MEGKQMSSFVVFFIVVFSQIFSLPQQLKKSDIRPTLEELFSYHVEYKELTPLLVKRTFKSYIEQFDAPKMYLLYGEVKPYLELSSAEVEGVMTGYASDSYGQYEQLNQTIAKAILRARAIRQEVGKELAANGEKIDSSGGEMFFQFPTTTDQLKSRIRMQMVRLLLSEKRSADPKFWTPERREKILSLYEKRYQRYESAYLPSDPKAEHYFAMHILKAMARSLDAHTAYFSPDEAFEMRASLEKQFEGVGIVLREGVDGVEVTDLVKGGPAARSGKIQIGDFLVAVDGTSVVNASYDEVLERLKGSGNKEVALGLKRFVPNGQEATYQVDLKREKILMQEERVQYAAEPFGDGYIGKLVLPSFYESSDAPSCEMDLREALKELKKKGKLNGLVLDMRENLGGFLNQAVKVAGLFITSGVVVISKYSQGEIQYMRNVDPRVYYNGPLVILTSKASASAAEIVAQALQDYGVGVVVGDPRTYGKGTIQYQTVTDNDAAAFFKVTVGRYYTVSGRSTQINGVQADIVVPTEFAPYNIGERYLEYPLPNDQVPAAYADPLADVDPQAKLWFQRNYLPYIQKKESIWTQMMPMLKKNSAYRIEHDPNFKLFLQMINGEAPTPDKGMNWGVEDLQMGESVNIVKDMISNQPVK